MLSDARALETVRSDPEAICVLYDRYLTDLVRFLQRSGASTEAAWDVSQETFARLLSRGYRGRLAPEDSAWPWLAVTSRNLLRDWQRRGRADERARHRLGLPVEGAAEQELDDALGRLDAERRSGDVGKALGSLPDLQYEAVVGRVVDELDYAALARRGFESEQTIRRRVSRGLRAMRGLIEGASA
ncbi:MAG: sigma-70 family RNA polymerase sigma factor [Actinobacteria bacterium]|nr:sigma-70 family RNA polymerase sigma factor [Actinomycetota bacterium]